MCNISNIPLDGDEDADEDEELRLLFLPVTPTPCLLCLLVYKTTRSGFAVLIL